MQENREPTDKSKRIKQIIILYCFEEEIKAGNYQNIQFFSEQLRITNKELLEEKKIRRHSTLGFVDCVLDTVAYLTAGKIAEDPALEEMWFSRMENEHRGYFERALRKNRSFMDTLLYEYKLMLEEDYTDFEDVFLRSYDLCETAYDDEYDKQLVFEDGTPIYTSKAYQRFLAKRRQELADYLHILPEELEEMFWKMFRAKYEIRDEVTALTVTYSLGGFVNLLANAILTAHRGSGDWYLSVFKDAKKMLNITAYAYKPNIHALIDKYYHQMVHLHCTRNDGVEMNRVELIRHVKSDTPRDDFIMITSMIGMDILCKMFDLMQDHLFTTFSWEKYTGQDLQTRYENMLAASNAEKEQQRRVLEEKMERLQSERTRLQEDLNGIELSWQRKYEALVKESQEKDEEIRELKERVALQEAWIDDLQKEPEEEELPKETWIPNGKYLFVGMDSRLVQELKQTYPDSSFMESEAMDLSGIQADAIVCLTRYMKHKMFYKIQARTNTTIIYANGKSVEAVQAAMAQQLRKE